MSKLSKTRGAARGWRGRDIAVSKWPSEWSRCSPNTCSIVQSSAAPAALQHPGLWVMGLLNINRSIIPCVLPSAGAPPVWLNRLVTAHRTPARRGATIFRGSLHNIRKRSLLWPSPCWKRPTALLCLTLKNLMQVVSLPEILMLVLKVNHWQR